MKASAFNYTKPATLPEALAQLSDYGDRAKVLSGGQSLMPALNLRLSAPELLVDIGGLLELRGIEVAADRLSIGALTRHADILVSPDIARLAPLLTEAMAHVAHPAIRNRGTIGGNLSHADPASEMPACMMALDAVIIARSAGGERQISATDFFTGIYETVLSPDELLVRVEIPLPAAGATHFFHEYSRRKGDYAIVGLAASAVVADGVFSRLNLGYFAVGDRPQLASASQYLIGKSVTSADLAAALVALDDELDPQEDQQATAGMRRHLARQLLTLCVARLLGRPELEARKSA